MAEDKIAKLLLVSREASALQALFAVSKLRGWDLDRASSGLEALEIVQSAATPDLVLLDLTPGDTDGLYVLRLFRRFRPELPVILFSSSTKSHEISQGLRLGARDCLVKPLEEQQLETVLERNLVPLAVNLKGSTEEYIEQIGDESFFIAASPTMHKLRAEAALLAKVDAPVLILGESGSGKEVIARLIHKWSTRSACTFLKVNCAALPPDLLESELFGYERGAFTGAQRRRRGKFELCDKGTILLDEVAEMPTSLQAKLLHVLQDKQYFRLGGETTIHVDVRVLAATNVKVEQALAEKKLREDLYYRLSTFTVHVPPLRQRRDEIPFLLRYFMDQMARQYDLPPRLFHPTLLNTCQSYAWPGNMRELENFVKRYLVIGDELLGCGEVDRRGENGSNNGHTGVSSEQDGNNGSTGSTIIEEHTPDLKSLLQAVRIETERNAIATALQETRWNRKAAARLLKVSYRSLLYKIEQYHMSPPSYLSPPMTLRTGRGNGHVE